MDSYLVEEQLLPPDELNGSNMDESRSDSETASEEEGNHIGSDEYDSDDSDIEESGPLSFIGRRTVKVKSAKSILAATHFFLTIKPSRGDRPMTLKFERIQATSFQLTYANLHALLDAIAAAHVRITSIVIDPEFVMPFGAHPPTVLRIFQLIGGLPFLENLWWFQTETPCLRGLTCILSAARRLVNLHCESALFAGEVQDFEHFAAAIQGHPTLKEIDFTGCTLAERNQTANSIYPVLAALQTVQNLAHLKLSCWVPPPAVTETLPSTEVAVLLAALAKVCSHPHLTYLSIDNSLCSKRCWVSTMAAIQENQSITSLSLENHLQKEECALLVEVLRTNKYLECLFFSLDDSDPDMADQHMLEVISALDDNPTMRSLYLYGSGDYVPSEGVQRAILSMLEHKNQVLTDIEFDPDPDSEMDEEWLFLLEMKHYLKLNKLGRKALLEDTNASREKWIHTLSRASEDPSALFFFLSKGPALCELPRKRVRPKLQASENAKRLRRGRWPQPLGA